jgi:hypothetical protein
MEIDRERTIEIAKLDDGSFIIKTYQWERTEDDGRKVYTDTLETVEADDKSDNETLKKLLFAISEKCGYMYNKYGKENMNITFDKLGHKIDNENEN